MSMASIPFDTLKFARHLEASGLTPATAAGASEALADALTGSVFATRDDISGVRNEIRGVKDELRNEIRVVRDELKNEIRVVKDELKEDIAGVKGEIGGLRHGIAIQHADMELLRRDLTIKAGGMMVIAVGILLAAIRYLPPHP
jgi:hypothetical protein